MIRRLLSQDSGSQRVEQFAGSPANMLPLYTKRL